MEVRPATPDDAAAVSRVLAEIVVAKGAGVEGVGVEGVGVEGDADFVRARYIDHPARVACTVAVIEGEVVGLQSLKRAWDGNPYDVPSGWGIIGTHIFPSAARQGVGRDMFAVSRDAAAAAGLVSIDARIGAGNAGGRAYYAAMGLWTRREPDDAVCKRYDLAPPQACPPRNASCRVHPLATRAWTIALPGRAR